MIYIYLIILFLSQMVIMSRCIFYVQMNSYSIFRSDGIRREFVYSIMISIILCILAFAMRQINNEIISIIVMMISLSGISVIMGVRKFKVKPKFTKRLMRLIIITEELLATGTDILDIGGESTRPGHVQISVEEEIERTAPLVEAIRKNFDVPISIDTYKSEVAEAALKAGADLVNDIWGFKYDVKMASLVKKYDAACCLMHNKNNTEYNDFIHDMYSDLQGCIDLAKLAGIEDDRIMLDPGVGFGKTYEMNLDVMRNLAKFNDLGYPMLLGTSRKSMIGLTLDLPADEREEGTLVTTVMAVQAGYGFVRVHDTKKNYRAIKMTEAILRR